MSDATPAVELPRFSRSIGRFAADSGSRQGRASVRPAEIPGGVLQLRGGILQPGLIGVEWPPAALSHLTLGPLLARHLPEAQRIDPATGDLEIGDGRADAEAADTSEDNAPRVREVIWAGSSDDMADPTGSPIEERSRSPVRQVTQAVAVADADGDDTGAQGEGANPGTRRTTHAKSTKETNAGDTQDGPRDPAPSGRKPDRSRKSDSRGDQATPAESRQRDPDRPELVTRDAATDVGELPDTSGSADGDVLPVDRDSPSSDRRDLDQQPPSDRTGERKRDSTGVQTEAAEERVDAVGRSADDATEGTETGSSPVDASQGEGPVRRGEEDRAVQTEEDRSVRSRSTGVTNPTDRSGRDQWPGQPRRILRQPGMARTATQSADPTVTGVLEDAASDAGSFSAVASTTASSREDVDSHGPLSPAVTDRPSVPRTVAEGAFGLDESRARGSPDHPSGDERGPDQQTRTTPPVVDGTIGRERNDDIGGDRAMPAMQPLDHDQATVQPETESTPIRPGGDRTGPRMTVRRGESSTADHHESIGSSSSTRAGQTETNRKGVGTSAVADTGEALAASTVGRATTMSNDAGVQPDTEQLLNDENVLNVPRLVDKLYHKLERKLRVERERRGRR